MIKLLLFICAVLFSAPAHAAGTNQPERILRPGQWTTDKDLCGGTCIAIQNLSRTECVAFGFADGGLDERLGNLIIVDGSGNGIGTWIQDGPDADRNLDFRSCVPPLQTVYGIVRGGSVDIKSIKYWTGMDNYSVPYLGLVLQIWGQYYGGTGEGIPSQGRLGNPRNVYTIERYTVMHIGG